MEEAIEWVKRCPNPFEGESEIEIRQVFEAEDFGAEFTPELRARDSAPLRARAHSLRARWASIWQSRNRRSFPKRLDKPSSLRRLVVGAFKFYEQSLRGKTQR